MVYRKDLREIGEKLYEAALERETLDTAITVLAVCLGGLILIPIFVLGVRRYLKKVASKTGGSDLEMGNVTRPVSLYNPSLNHDTHDAGQNSYTVNHKLKYVRDNDALTDEHA